MVIYNFKTKLFKRCVEAILESIAYGDIDYFKPVEEYLYHVDQEDFKKLYKLYQFILETCNKEWPEQKYLPLFAIESPYFFMFLLQLREGRLAPDKDIVELNNKEYRSFIDLLKEIYYDIEYDFKEDSERNVFVLDMDENMFN